MLDQLTKRKIDSVRDVLVGKVPDPKAQVEQITTALIYKFMDDMDRENEEVGLKAQFFAAKRKQYAWARLLDGRLSGPERLSLYVRAIADIAQNPRIPRLFRDIFKGVFLPYNDPRTLTLFLKEINDFHYEHSEDLGDAFEYLLSVLGSQGDAGQFRTPRHIIDFMVAAVAPQKNETILDPACGTAGFLISAYKHILRQNEAKPLTPDEKLKLMNNLAGYDISPDMVRLALVNMYLHGFPEPKIHEYDTLTSEQRWDETFAVILANPPFMTPKGGIKPHQRFSVQARRSEVLFVDYILEHLSLRGRAGIIVPEGVVFKTERAYTQIRQKLCADGLWAVVSLPPGVFQPYSGVKTSILFFDKQFIKKTDKILFIEIKNDGFDLGAQRRKIEKNDLPEALAVLAAWQQGLEKKSELAIWAPQEKIAAAGDYNLSGGRYKMAKIRKNQKWPLVELKEVAALLRGQGLTKSDLREKGRNKCVHYGQLYTLYGQVIKEAVSRTDRDGKILSVSGDVLVPGTTTAGPLGIATASALLEDGVIIGGDINILRIDKAKINPVYLAYLLSGPLKKELAAYARGTNIIHLLGKDLLKIKIPRPPLEAQGEIVSQIEAKQQAINHAREIIKNLERERERFGYSLRKLNNARLVELGEICEIKGGKRIPRGKTFSGVVTEYPYIRVVDFMNGTINLSKVKYISGDVFARIRKYTISQEDVYMSIAGTIGVTGTVPRELDGKSLTENAAKLVIKNKAALDKNFLAYILQNTDSQEQIKSFAKGAGIPKLALARIARIKIPLPALEIQRKLAAAAAKEREIINAGRQLIAIMKQKITNVLEESWY